MINLNDILLAQQGDINSIEKTINYYYPRVFYYNRHLFHNKNDKQDLIQEGIIGLLKAIKAYDPLKQVSFNSFANICIQRNIISAIKKKNSTKNKILNKAISDNIYNSREDLLLIQITPEHKLLELEFNKTIFKILNNKLSDFEKIICSYLLYGYNYLEISNILNKDKKKIDNAIQRIRKKVKFNSKLD